MTKKRKSVIGIDLGRFVVKMVEYSSAKKHITTIAKLFIEPGEWDNESVLSEKLSDWILDKKQSKNPELVAAVPAEYAVVKQFSMPPDEMKPEEVIAWELGNYLASPLSEYAFDYFPLSKSTNARRYLAAAYQKPELERFKRIIHLPGLPLTVIDIDILATFNAWEVNYPDESNKNILLIKADLNRVYLIFITQGQLGSYHLIPVPDSYIIAEDLERGKLITALMDDIKKYLALETAKNVLPGGIDKCIFCGDLATDLDFTESLRSAVEIDTIGLDAFKEIKFPHDPEFADKVAETSPQCATALGLALRHEGDV